TPRAPAAAATASRSPTAKPRAAATRRASSRMSPERPLRVAVVGSGPAGFYAADALLEAGAGVDLLERLPTPWGLVRLGVAPDHPELKTASRVFEKTAAKAGFRFFGNVDVGRDVTHDELVRLFDAVVYTVGAQTDRSGSRARISPARGPRPSSSPGTTAIPTSRSSSSTSRASGRW